MKSRRQADVFEREKEVPPDSVTASEPFVALAALAESTCTAERATHVKEPRGSLFEAPEPQGPV